MHQGSERKKGFSGKRCKRNHVSIGTDGGRMAAFPIHFKMYFDNNFYNFLKKILYFLLTKYILKCIIISEVEERTEYKNEKI
jgi:hypothetical protein